MSKLTTNDIAFALVIETARAIETANAMVRDAEVAAKAKLEAERQTNCRYCQAEIENFLIQFPDASDEAVEECLRGSWETCGACSEEYLAHLERQAEASSGFYLDNPSDWERQNLENGNGGA